MNDARQTLALLSTLFAAVVTSNPLAAQDVLPRTFTPSVSASILDQPRDGLGDSFDPTFPGLLREQSTRENRAIQEFDLNGLTSADVFQATLSTEVSVNNAANNGLRTFDFLLYPGNGVADLSDFEIAGTVVGTGSYSPPVESSFTVSFDVTTTLRAILDTGTDQIGLRVDPTSNPNFPNVLGSATTLTVDVGLSEFGTSTSWTSGTPRARFAALPSPTLPIPLELSGNPANGTVFWLLGFSALPSPIDLSPIGLQPGAVLLIDPLTSGTVVADASGNATPIVVTLPNRPAIVGASLLAQSLTLDPLLPFPIPLATSRAVEAVIR